MRRKYVLAKTAGAEGLEASRGSGDQMPAGAVCPRQPCRSVQGGKRPAGRDGRRELDTTAPGPSLPWPSSSRPLAAAAARACCPPGSCAAGPGLPSVATTATARYQPRLLPLSAGMGRGAGGPGCGGCGRAAAHAPSGQRPSPPGRSSPSGRGARRPTVAGVPFRTATWPPPPGSHGLGNGSLTPPAASQPRRLLSVQQDGGHLSPSSAPSQKAALRP